MKRYYVRGVVYFQRKVRRVWRTRVSSWYDFRTLCPISIYTGTESPSTVRSSPSLSRLVCWFCHPCRRLPGFPNRVSRFPVVCPTALPGTTLTFPGRTSSLRLRFYSPTRPQSVVCRHKHVPSATTPNLKIVSSLVDESRGLSFLVR